MRKLIIATLLIMELTAAKPGEAAPRPIASNMERPFGAGIILGEPSGLTAKYWLGPRSAVDFGTAFSFNDYFLIYGDYLWHFPDLLGGATEFTRQLHPYLGVGAVVLFDSDDTGSRNRAYFRSDQGSAGLAIRIPVGAEWKPAALPLGVFAEIVPGLGVAPETFGMVQGGIGLRYYFG